MAAVRVLIIDDSAQMRVLLSDLLNADPAIEVVGAAASAEEGRQKIKQLNPDVVTLDVDMPDMDGLQFLKNLMRLRPMPVVMVSSTCHYGAEVTLRALALGAVDFVNRPRVGDGFSVEDWGVEIVGKVKNAATAKVMPLDTPAVRRRRRRPIPRQIARPPTDGVIAIGASTGGTEAIKDVLLGLSTEGPAVVIAQHIPPGFSRSFAERMDRSTPLTVCEAEEGMRLLQGHAYIAPGGRHLEIVHRSGHLRCHLSDAPPVNRHRPSVDVLFDSVAATAGSNAIGIILTGMGRDGAAGLARLRAAGARTFAQDKASSVVFGMPQAAIQLDAVDSVLPPRTIAATVANLLLPTVAVSESGA